MPVTNYSVYKDGSLLVILGNITTYTDSSLATGEAHNYSISAINVLGESAQCVNISAITAHEPLVPTNFTVDRAGMLRFILSIDTSRIARPTNFDVKSVR